MTRFRAACCIAWLAGAILPACRVSQLMAADTPAAMVLTPALTAAISDMRVSLSRMTNRSFDSDVPMTSLSEREVRDFLVVKLKQDYPGTAIADEQKAYVHLGLLSAGDDLESLFVSMLTEQAAGFYDPDKRRLFLVSGKPFPGIALVHELAHALQDQTYGLSGMMEEARSNDDRLLAVQSMVEGEAMALSARYAASHPKMEGGLEGLGGSEEGMKVLNDSLESLARMPPILQENLMFPYVQGMAWADSLVASGGQQLMDQIFRKPPESSEQIIHPDKSKTPRDIPSIIDPALLPVLAAEEYRTVKKNTLGEFNISQLFGGRGDPEASAVADGWDGDLYAVYEKQAGGTSMIWLVVWDTPADARQFLTRARAWLGRRHPGSPAFAIGQPESSDRITYIVEGFDDALRGRLADMLKSRAAAKVTPR